MLHLLRPGVWPGALTALALALTPPSTWAQNTPKAARAMASPPTAAAVPEALTAELFYEILLGELSSSNGDPGTGYTLMLQAARQTDDAQLYRRAVEIALQARAGDSALAAARAWHAAQPQSREATRQLLQILVALNRIDETPALLQTTLEQTPEASRSTTLQSIPALYARASDKAQAAAMVEQALKNWLDNPSQGAAAWAALGRMRIAAGDKPGALEAALQAYKRSPREEATVLLALELLEEGVPSAHTLLVDYFAGDATPELRMVYARLLLAQQRYPEAALQLRAITVQKPDMPEPWLLQATLQTQDNQLDAAEQSLQRYDALLEQSPHSRTLHQGASTQALLLHAQLAEKRGDYEGAQNWLLRIENGQTQLGVQLRRASLLVRQGRLDHARALIQAFPASDAQEEREKLSAEVQVLRQAKEYAQAYALQRKVVSLTPGDNDQLYDMAMLAEKAGQYEAMQQALRTIIARKGDYHHALNTLGYWYADRGERLPEAKALIEKALSYAPGDPYITDSLGWVEFRMGRHEQALALLQQAFAQYPDAEIAAHLGEVQWAMGQQEGARQTWREGLRLNPQNDTLLTTLKRLGVQP